MIENIKTKNIDPMKNVFIISFLVLSCFFRVNAQNNILLNFSGINNTEPVLLDHVWISNVTRGCDTTLPTGVMSINLGPVGITEFQDLNYNHVRILEGTINPFFGKTEIGLFLPENGQLSVTVNDLSGRNYLNSEMKLNKGFHYFQFTAGNQALYLLSFRTKSGTASIKLISLESHSKDVTFELTGNSISKDFNLKNKAGNFVFAPGDQLILVGYSGGSESGIIKNPSSSQTIIFQFAKDIPCPGLPVLTYEGKDYNTVQIMSQCWLKENLDIGNQINGTIAQSDNGVIEKYCFNDDINNCTLYGGLYQWSEMMKYINDSVSIQGICPGDWHIATDLEWMLLEGTADSHYGIGDPTWWRDGNRGTDAGKNLKSAAGWKDNGSGTDLYGFTALPGGIHHDDNTFIGLTKYACFWTSSRSISVFASHARLIDYYYNLVYRDQYERTDARSVRCIKNY
jgi:uncharacterized protein (TIGR02145 family)